MKKFIFMLLLATNIYFTNTKAMGSENKQKKITCSWAKLLNLKKYDEIDKREKKALQELVIELICINEALETREED